MRHFSNLRDLDPDLFDLIPLTLRAMQEYDKRILYTAWKDRELPG